MHFAKLINFSFNFYMNSSISLEILSTNYKIMEHFYTIQGEGFWTGTPAYFIRFAGCEVGCHWCDVKESWEESIHPSYKVADLLEFAQSTPAQRIVITGGEPLQQNLVPLTTALKNQSFQLHLETSGAFPLSGQWDWICLSPKKFKKPLKEIFSIVNELKVIVFNASDFLFAEEYASFCPKNTHLFLQPEWSKEKIMLPEIIDYVKKNPQWRISLQTHKYMNIP